MFGSVSRPWSADEDADLDILSREEFKRRYGRSDDAIRRRKRRLREAQRQIDAAEHAQGRRFIAAPHSPDWGGEDAEDGAPQGPPAHLYSVPLLETSFSRPTSSQEPANGPYAPRDPARVPVIRFDATQFIQDTPLGRGVGMLIQSDAHLGSAYCLEHHFYAELQYARRHGLILAQLGDLFDRSSITAKTSAYEQRHSMTMIYRVFFEWMRPLVPQLVFACGGNHDEGRDLNHSGFNWLRNLYWHLGADDRYAHDQSGILRLRVGDQSYVCRMQHQGPRDPRRGATEYGDYDLYACGHTHKRWGDLIPRAQAGEEYEETRWQAVVCCGGYLTYGGYARRAGYGGQTQAGGWLVWFSAEDHSISIDAANGLQRLIERDARRPAA